MCSLLQLFRIHYYIFAFKNFQPEKFVNAVQKLSWFEVYMSENVNEVTEMVTSKLTAILDIMAPVKMIGMSTEKKEILLTIF